MDKYMPDKLLDRYCLSDVQSSLLNLYQDFSIIGRLDNFFFLWNTSRIVWGFIVSHWGDDGIALNTGVNPESNNLNYYSHQSRKNFLNKYLSIEIADSECIDSRFSYICDSEIKPSSTCRLASC